MHNTKKVFVDSTILKNEAKSIYKQNNKILEYTKVLDIILSGLNFNSYNEYQRYFKTQVNAQDTIDMHDIDIYSLSLIEDKLLSTLKNFNCIQTKKIFFIRNEINKRINEQLHFYPDLTLIQILSVYRNVSLDFIHLIDDHNIDKDSLKNLIDYLIKIIPTIHLNNFNLFSLYSICLKEPEEINNIKELIKNADSKTNTIELKMFVSALNNLTTDNNSGDGRFFELLYDIYTSFGGSYGTYLQQKNSGRIKIDKKIEEIIKITKSDEIKYRDKLEHKSKINDKLFIPYPEFNMSFDNNLVLFFKKQTNFGNSLYIGEKKNSIFKKPMILNTEESRENKFFIGYPGSGRNESILSILFQHIINNKSVIYFDYFYDVSLFAKLYHLSTIAGRSNDFCYFHETEDHLDEKILSAYKKNKIIFIFPKDPVEKTSDSNIYQYYSFLGSILKKINTTNKIKLKNYLPDAIYFPSYGIHKSDLLHDNEFKLFLNTTKLSILSSAFDFFHLTQQRDLGFLEAFKFQFVMKTDDFDSRIINLLDNFDSNILRHQEPGDFTLFKYDGKRFNFVETGYKFKFLDVDMRRLNMIIKHT